MSYTISASSTAKQEGLLNLQKDATISFGVTNTSGNNLPSPADVFLSALAACILKNVERFSEFMKFEYQKATVTVSASHVLKPPMLENITYELTIYSTDKTINISLLQRNLAKFGTIYNMVSKASHISGKVVLGKA